MISLLSFIAYILVFLTVASIWWYLSIPKNLPSGPIGLPFFGSMFETWKASGLDKRLLQWAEKYGPVYKLYIGEKLVVVLADWDSIQEVLVKQGENFTGRPQLIQPGKQEHHLGLVNAIGELWKTQRRFALSTLREFGIGKPILEPQIKEECENLIQEIESYKGKPQTLSTLINNAVSNVICALIFGKRFEYSDETFHGLLTHIRKRLTEEDISMLTPFILSPTVGNILKLLPQIQEFLAEGNRHQEFCQVQINEIMESFDVDNDEATNYVQAFYKARKERQDNWTFTDEQLMRSVSDLFIAGTDTTATTLRWSIFFMAHNPHIQDKVYEEIKGETGTHSLPDYGDRGKMPYVEAAIMECQRMANLIPLGVLRSNNVACKLHGYDIPAGTAVLPLLAAVLRDPKVYPNPDTFDPTRFMKNGKDTDKSDQVTHLIPFQAGKRICLGESLARMELFLFFTALFSQFKFTFAEDKPIPAITDEKVSFIRGPPNYDICAVKRE